MNYYNYPKSGHLENNKKLFSFADIPLLLILVLSCLNFFGYGIHMVVFFFLLYFLFSGKIQYSENVFALLLLTVAVLFFWEDSLDGPTTITRCVVWPMAFLLGHDATNMETWDEAGAERTEKKVNIYVRLIVIGFFTHFALNFYINRGEVDLGRNTKDIWSKSAFSATGQAMLACIPLGWSVASFINNSGIRKRIPALIVLTIILMYNLVLSTRTLFLMILVVTLIAVIYLVIAANKKHKKMYAVMAVLAVLVLVVIGFQNNLFGMQDYFEESEFYFRFFGDGGEDITSDSRMENKLKFLELMPLNLWGGGHIRRYTGSYAHDLFLDLYDDAGILALIAVIAMVAGSIRVLLSVLKNKQIKFETRMTLLCVFSAIYIEFMVEPIFIGAPDVLMMFCFLYGVIVKMDKNMFTLQHMKCEETVKG